MVDSLTRFTPGGAQFKAHAAADTANTNYQSLNTQYQTQVSVVNGYKFNGSDCYPADGGGSTCSAVMAYYSDTNTGHVYRVRLSGETVVMELNTYIYDGNGWPRVTRAGTFSDQQGLQAVDAINIEKSNGGGTDFLGGALGNSSERLSRFFAARNQRDLLAPQVNNALSTRQDRYHPQRATCCPG